tara:strand:- start:5331 stop:5720 length:390 start_codon:yes stop_codon:yes gene_type:complete
MGINSTEVAYGFGQLGSVFNDGTAAMAPPTGKVFVAITMLTDCTFDTSAGLVADNDSSNGLEYIGTVFARDTDGTVNDAAHDESSSTDTLGSGGTVVDVNNTFSEGITIYGRWTSINPASGTMIAYIGN